MKSLGRSSGLALVLALMGASPALAQEAILLNVNQTHTLQWDWTQGDHGPIQQFVFQCQQYRKDLEADARSLTFRRLIDEPGRYTGCTLSAKNEAGLSAPVVIPDFDYAYSYKALGLFLLELLAMAGAVSGTVAVYGRRIVSRLAETMQRRPRASAALALPEPSFILHKERDHVYRAR